MSNRPFDDKLNLSIADAAKKVMDESSHHNFKEGDKVHLGMGAKGGAGYKGTLSKLEGDTAHVEIDDPTAKFGPRVVKGHVSKLTKEEVEQVDEAVSPKLK